MSGAPIRGVRCSHLWCQMSSRKVSGELRRPGLLMCPTSHISSSPDPLAPLRRPRARAHHRVVAEGVWLEPVSSHVRKQPQRRLRSPISRTRRHRITVSQHIRLQPRLAHRVEHIKSAPPSPSEVTRTQSVLVAGDVELYPPCLHEVYDFKHALRVLRAVEHDAERADDHAHRAGGEFERLVLAGGLALDRIPEKENLSEG